VDKRHILPVPSVVVSRTCRGFTGSFKLLQGTKTTDCPIDATLQVHNTKVKYKQFITTACSDIIKLMIEAVIFDVDGVVVDSDKLQVEAEQKTAKILAEELAIELDFDNIDWSHYQGWGRTKIAKALFGDQTSDAVCEDYRERVVDCTIEIANIENLSAIKDINKFMDFLVVRGILIGAATSSNRRIYEKYTELADMERIRTSVAHFECIDNKPKPGPYREVMRRLGTEPSKTLIIEDSPSSINGARYSGATVLGLASIRKPVEVLRDTTDAHLVAEDFKHAAHLLQRYLP
jgi:beta-phosphoglucomutase-like phosphatase (HAD superfamily)